jgi:adenylate cyclase
VTILFSDLVGFTKLSSRLSAADLVRLMNELFSEFDRLALGFGVEKIKTIGDAYMLVGGLPEPRADHAHAVADMA